MSFLKFYNKYRYEIFLCISIFAFIVLFFVGRDKNNKFEGINSFNISKKKKTYGKHENKCRSILEKYFNKPFNKIRPDFLKQPNGKNLELDMYNQELNIACEYNGVQHEKYSPFFHKSYQDFIDQQNRDQFKYNKCRELNIKLIVVPSSIKYENLESYIKNEIKKIV
jgi:hypothetical protein